MIGVSFEEGKVLFMKICAHCGNAMNDEAKFCVNCGTQANGYSNYTYQSQQNRNFLIIAKCLGKILEQEKWLVELFGFALVEYKH